MLVDGSFDNPRDPSKTESLPLDGCRLFDAEGCNPLSFPRTLPTSEFLGSRQPGIQVLAARIPFQDEIGRTPRQCHPRLPGIMAAIQADQNRSGRQLAGIGQDPLQRVQEFVLTMLLAFPQFTRKTPAFLP